MCKHCEHNKPKFIGIDYGFDTEFRKSFTSEIEYCKEYAMPCYDAILHCTIINKENQE